MRLPTSTYMLLGLLLGFIVVAALVVPAIYGQHDSTGTGTGDNTGGGSDDNGGGGDNPTVPAYDPEHYYKAEGTIRVYVDGNGDVKANFMWVKVVQYQPAPINLPDFPALSWTEADYRIKVQFIDLDGKIKEKTVYDDVIRYTDQKILSFDIDMGHWSKGTLRIVVERMDSRPYIGDVRNVAYGIS